MATNFLSGLLPLIANNPVIGPGKFVNTQPFQNSITQAAQDVASSPGAQAVEGNYNQILPAIKKEFSGFKMTPSGPTFENGKYAPQVMFSGEMGAAPEAGIAPKVSSQLPEVKPKPLPKTQFNVTDKVTAPDAAKSVFGSEHTSNIQDALKRNGVQDYSQVAQAAHNLYDNIIKPALFNNPKPISIDNVTNAIVDEMRKMKPGIDQVAAKKAAGSVIQDMYAASRGTSNDVQLGKGPGGTGGGALVPTHIDTPALFGIKQGLNSTDAVKNYFAGNPPQDIGDSATVASRNALGKIIQSSHPEVAQATRDYGLLQDSVPSIYKLTNQAANDAANAPGPDPMSYIPGSPLLGKGLNKFGNKILTNPTAQKVLGGSALVGAGAGATLALPQIKNTLDNSIKSNANQNGSQVSPHGTVISQNVPDVNSIPQSMNDLKPDANGNYGVANPFTVKGSDGNSLALSPQEHALQTSQIDNMKKDPRYAYVPAYKQQVDATKEALDTKYEDSQTISKAYQLTNSLNNNTVDARAILKIAPPNLLQKFSSIDALRKSTDPAYARLGTDLQAIAAKYPGVESIFGAKTSAVAYAQLDQLNKIFLNDYYQGLGAYVGGPQPQSSNSGVSQLPQATQQTSFPSQQENGQSAPIQPNMQLAPLPPIQ